MRFAVTDDNAAVCVHEHAMRATHPALECVAARAVAAFAGAGDEFEGPALHINHADAMALGVGQIHVAVQSDAESLWAGEGRLLRRTAVAGEALLARAGDLTNDPSLP